MKKKLMKKPIKLLLARKKMKKRKNQMKRTMIKSSMEKVQ